MTRAHGIPNRAYSALCSAILRRTVVLRPDAGVHLRHRYSVTRDTDYPRLKVVDQQFQ